MISLRFIQVAEISVRGHYVSEVKSPTVSTPPTPSEVSVRTPMSAATAPSPHDPLTVSLDPPTPSSTALRTEEFRSEVLALF